MIKNKLNFNVVNVLLKGLKKLDGINEYRLYWPWEYGGWNCL